MTRETTATHIDESRLDSVCGGMVLVTSALLQTQPESTGTMTLQGPDSFAGGAPTFGEYTYQT